MACSRLCKDGLHEWCKDRLHEWCMNRSPDETHCTCDCHGSARQMVFGDIYLCHSPIMARGDDLRKAWMWYASQSDRGTVK